MKIADLELPPVLYHGTSVEAYERIAVQGLDPGATRWKRSQMTVFLTDEPHVAENYVLGFHEKGIVLAIDTRGLDPGLLGPDDYELPEFMDEPWGEVGDDLRPYMGDGSKPGHWNWSNVPWQLSLKYVQQVAYAGHIDPKWISVAKRVRLGEAIVPFKPADNFGAEQRKKNKHREPIGYQVANAEGYSIQGDPDDPSRLPSFLILKPPAVDALKARYPHMRFCAIYDGDIEEPSFAEDELDLISMKVIR